MRLLDLFCGAGGAAMGYYQAGFTDIVGVDIEPQKRYPFELVRADAFRYLENLILSGEIEAFDFIHASPKCQRDSQMSRRWNKQHPDQITPIRQLLIKSGRPYIIENVPNAQLVNPIVLCGTMFNLQTRYSNQLRRHRLFESSLPIVCNLKCNHNNGSAIGVHGGGQHPDRRRPVTIGVYGNSGGSSKRDNLVGFSTQDRRDAMGINWMSRDELSQAIPPAYTKWIGEQILSQL